MSTAARFCPQCGAPAAPYALICSNCGKSLSEASSVPPTQYAIPSSSVPPTQYASPPSTDPYGSSAYGTPAASADPYSNSAYGASSTPITSPYSSSPYEVNSAAPPPPVGISSMETKKKSRRGLWIGLGVVAVLLIACVAGLFVLGSAKASTPTMTLQAYCAAINTHDAPTAYSEFSKSAQQQLSGAKFAQEITAEKNCVVSNVSDSAGNGTLVYTLVNGLKLSESDTLINENGSWKINGQQVQSSPTFTLLEYCQALKKGDFQTAYDQFSQNYQSMQSESAFAKSFTSPVSDCQVSNVDDLKGTGGVTYTYGGSGGTQFGDETLVNQNGTWKIDSEKLSQ